VNYNHVDPTEKHSYIDGWLSLWHRGEPYGGEEWSELASAMQDKGSYTSPRSAEYLDLVKTGKVRAVPVLAQQGWTDPLFTPSQALQMYRRMKQASNGYPITLLLGATGGHIPMQHPGHVALAEEATLRFVDAHLLAGGIGAPPPVMSMSTDCLLNGTKTAPVRDVIRSGSWDTVSNHVSRHESSERRVTVNGPSDAAEPTYDPEAHRNRFNRDATVSTCITADPVPTGSTGTSARWEWAVDADTTLVGLPTLRATYSLTGTDATVAARLWDVAPTGKRTLVTRGVYRLTGPDSESGTFETQLFGNHWQFAAGHRVQLELSQTDAPFLRPNNLPSRIDWTGVQLTLPERR
jgi:hypothetical protein